MVKWARRPEPPLSSSLSARQNGMSVSSWRRRRACSARAPTVHRSTPSSWPFRSGPRARSFSTSVGCFAPLRQDECRGPRLRGPRLSACRSGAKHPTDVLNDRALGPDRKGQEEGVERWTVGALAEQARRRRQDETDIPFRRALKLLDNGGSG